MEPNFAPMESCWGVPSPNLANMKNGKQYGLKHSASRFFYTVLLDRPLASFSFSHPRLVPCDGPVIYSIIPPESLSRTGILPAAFHGRFAEGSDFYESGSF